MQRTLIAGFTLALLLLGPQVFAQVEPNRAPQADGRSLGMPHHQQQADDAMNTPSGRAGRDEPGAHAQTENKPVFKDGKIDVPSTPADRQTSPTPDQSVGQRP
jgi:hypothetical protein